MARSALTSSLLGTLKWTFAGIVMVVIVAGIGNRLIGLQNSTEAARGVKVNTAKTGDQKTAGDDGEERPAEDVTREDRALFFNLLDAKVLTPRKDGGIDRKSSDYILVMKAAEKTKGDGGVPLDTQARYLSMLYHKSVGTIIRQQVRLWNETRRIAGIRDNRPRTEAERGKAQWRATSGSGHPLRTGSLVPEAFGFVHGASVSVGFSDWETVAAQKTNVRFSTRIKLAKSQTITIQVAGDVVSAPAGAKIERKEVKPYERKKFWPCEIPTKAAVVRMMVPASASGVPISVTVKPAVNCDPRVYGLAISMAPKDRDGYDKALVAYNKALRKWKRTRKAKRGAEPQKPTVEWVYLFRPVERAKKTEKRFSIRTLDGKFLTDPGGKPMPTDEAFNLGLVNLVGFGPADANSLMGMLSQSKIPSTGLTVTLTIDSRIQQIAQNVVNYYLGTVFPRESGGRYKGERKNALALLDADTGAILAVAGWPLPPKGASSWDYTSFAAAKPLRDPMAIFAWEVIDKHYTPGSTMKPLLGLAMARANRSDLNRIMLGLSPAGVSAATGLNVGSGTYSMSDKHSISNFGKTALSSYFGSPGRRADCVPGGQVVADPNFGLAQAVQFSINMWFARVAVMLEEDDVNDFTAKLRAMVKAKKAPRQLKTLPATRLMKSLRLIGISDTKRMDLGVNVPKELGLYRLNTSGGADILYTQTPRTHVSSGEPLDTYNPAAVRILYIHRIGLNGIGQGWSVSPLHMARGAASIASGRRVQPHILAKWGATDLKTPDAPIIPTDPNVLKALRTGMKAVPEAARSTAGYIFRGAPLYVDGKSGKALAALRKRLTPIQKSIGCRTYGKTGTADVDKGLGYNSGWFMGWKEPVRPDGRRIAFACMTTHAIGSFRFGGSSCGRIIRDIMTGIEYMQGPVAATDKRKRTERPRRKVRRDVRGPRVAPRLDGPRQR